MLDRAARRRPRAVTWLALGVLVVAAGNLVSAVAILSRWALLTGLDLALPAWALVAYAVLWGAAALLAACGVLWLRPWARWGLLAGAPLYAAAFAARQALFAPGSAARGKLPFTLGVAVAMTALAVVILTRPQVRRAFDDPTDPDEETH